MSEEVKVLCALLREGTPKATMSNAGGWGAHTVYVHEISDSLMRRAATALEALQAELERVKGENAWRCFHCDEVFTDERAARLHFGSDEGVQPACQIKGSEGGLIEALRRAEKDAADAWHAIHAETTDAAKAYHAQSARHHEQLRAVEQVGYDRGIADAKAHPETLGLIRAEVEVAKLREGLQALVDSKYVSDGWVAEHARALLNETAQGAETKP